MSAAQHELTVGMQQAPVHRLDFVDGLRAAAALYVMLYHAWLTAYWGVRQPSRMVAALAGWLGYGHYAVGVFIVLSGFCLMMPVVRGDGTLRGGAKAFLKRRAWRILPAYYCVLAVSIVLAITLLRHKTGTLWDYSLPVTKTGVAAHVLLLHNLHRSLEINSPLWSVAVEWQLYFVFPLIVLTWRRAGGVQTVLGVICVSGAAYTMLSHTRLAGLNCQFLALFGLGMLAAAISFAPQTEWIMMRQRYPWRLCSISLFCCIMLVCLEQHLAAVFSGTWFMEFLVGLWAMSLLIYAACPSATGLRRCLEYRPLVFIGMFSYSIYLLHLPLLQLIWQYGICPLHCTTTAAFIVLMCVGSIVAVAVSYLFFLLCERPFLIRRATR